MIRILFSVLAIAALIWCIGWIRRQSRLKLIEEMKPEELVDAVIRRDISILEVPPAHRKEVDQMLKEIQAELEQ